MKWFNRKNSNKPKSTPGVDFGPTSDNRLLFIILAFAIAAFFVRTGFVQSEVVILTQDTWITEDASSNATLPAVEWDEYSVRDAGVVAGDDLHLESSVYTMTQTSNDGVTDTCDTNDCSTGGGFNGATAVKTGTTVSGTGINASVKLIIEEFTLNLLGSYDTSDASGIYVDGNTAYIADGNSGLYLIDISTAAKPEASMATYATFPIMAISFAKPSVTNVPMDDGLAGALTSMI